jgi:hypothetical protein
VNGSKARSRLEREPRRAKVPTTTTTKRWSLVGLLKQALVSPQMEVTLHHLRLALLSTLESREWNASIDIIRAMRSCSRCDLQSEDQVLLDRAETTIVDGMREERFGRKNEPFSVDSVT